MHGGNFQWFGASSILFDGRFLANQGDVVVVTINYRLGIQNINEILTQYLFSSDDSLKLNNQIFKKLSFLIKTCVRLI